MTGKGLAVQSGTDLVDPGTGEVVGRVAMAPFDMGKFLGGLDATAIANQKALSAAYDQACESLIGPNDVQVEGNRTFKKKSAWRKLARYFGISTVVVRTDREVMPENDYLVATVVVRAIGPWGQSAEAVGACGTDEESGRRKITIADAIATAETRATNRAVSNLIAMGEVSAEEMSKGNGGGGSREAKPAREKVMPVGANKGKKLGDIDTGDLEGFLNWQVTKAPGKFADLSDAIREVLAERAPAAQAFVESIDRPRADDEFPAALEDTDDDLPF